MQGLLAVGYITRSVLTKSIVVLKGDKIELPLTERVLCHEETTVCCVAAALVDHSPH